MLKDIIRNTTKYKFELLLICLLLPLYLIKHATSLDWGDDFAGYILQAYHHNNTAFTPAIENYLYNPDYFIYAPERYPPFYPFILWIFSRITHSQFSNYAQLNTTILLFWAVSVYVFLKREYKVSALIAAILLAYFPFIIELKNEILSDFLFSFLIIISILFHKENKNNKNLYFILSGIFACLAFLTKSLGIFLPITFILISIINWQGIKALLLYYAGFFVCLISGLLLFEWKEFQNLIFFSKIAQHISTYDALISNMNLYTDLVNYFPINFSNKYSFLIKWIYASLTTMGLIGVLLSFKKKSEADLYFRSLFMLIFIFPNSRQGLRYLLPLFPFFIMYIFQGFQAALSNHEKVKTAFKITITAALVIILYKPVISAGLNKKINSSDSLDQNTTTKPLIDFLKTTVSENETICFKKARAIVLYTNKKCFANNIEHSLSDTQKEMQKYKPDYFITGNLDLLYNPALDNFIKTHSLGFDTVFKNSNYTVLKWKKTSTPGL